MNAPTYNEVRDWYMGYGVKGRAELAEVEGNAFDRYLLERDAKVAKATEERIIKLLDECVCGASVEKCMTCECNERKIKRVDLIALIKGENK